MDRVNKDRNCLICSVPIAECHLQLGIDSCRACAVFYKRIRSTNRPPKKCKGGEGKCIEKYASTSCRKCRYDRFSEVMNNAADCDDEFIPEIPQVICDPEELCRPKEIHVETAFIDHSKFLEDQPSCSDTPLLDKIISESLMCQTRKSGETATKPVSYHLSQGEFDGSKIRFVPTTYSMIVPNYRIFASALYDFAKMTFPDFSKLSDVNRGYCIANSFQQVNLIESNYRSAHHFPKDIDTYFAIYTTFMNDESIQSFLDDCPFETNTQEAIESFKVAMARTKSMNREFFCRVKPDDVEFLALLGLSFWNTEVAIVNEELSETVEQNRDAILKELQRVYKARRKKDYAARLGELFALLDNIVENVTLTQHDIEVYKLHNLFNEAFPAECMDPEIPESFVSR